MSLATGGEGESTAESAESGEGQLPDGVTQCPGCGIHVADRDLARHLKLCSELDEDDEDGEDENEVDTPDENPIDRALKAAVIERGFSRPGRIYAAAERALDDPPTTRTLRTHLHDLVDRGVLTYSGRKRGRRYEPADDLEGDDE